jgi:HPt (histidine-containing phosphotransfer) domain-containing protein
MLGHVSKPISKAALAAAVAQHALPRAAKDMPAKATVFANGAAQAPTTATTATPAASAVAPAPPATAPLPATPLRDEITALEQLGGDRELLDELVEMFMAGLADQAKELQRTGELGDWPALSKLAHAQKGAAGAVGATAARASASALETACYAKDVPTALQHLTELLKHLEALLAEHQRERQTH